MKLFVDTWGWIELNNKRSPRYREVTRFYRKFLQKMVVMSELGITDVLTEDDHFLQVGMGFNKVP